MDIRDWLSQTPVSSLMTRAVVTLHPDDPLAHAASVFLREQITGAPVVDADGRCLGVLSVSDLVGAEEKVAAARQQLAGSTYWTTALALPVSVYAEKLAEVRDQIAPSAEQPVRNFMTRDLVAVPANTPLESAVRKLMDAHIHRLLVVDADQQLSGILSTTDVLAALLRG
jgi:CBS domain-containing protein